MTHASGGGRFDAERFRWLEYTLLGRPMTWQRTQPIRLASGKASATSSKKTREGRDMHTLVAAATMRELEALGCARHMTQAKLRMSGKPNDIRCAFCGRQARERWPLEGAFAVHVTGYWPDGNYGDVDRLASLAMDALEGVAYKTDRQVQWLTSLVMLDREEPRTKVRVERMGT